MDAYRIGVSIVLANGVSPILAIIGKDFAHLNTSVSAIRQNMAGWGTAIGAASLALAGTGILKTVTALAEKAADFQDAMTKVAQLNPKVSALVNSGDIKRLSFNVGEQLGMKVEDVTKVYGGIYGVLQDPEEAEKITPIAARYARLMQMRHPGSHPEESINTLMRAGELSGRLTDDKGAIDPEKVKEWFDMAARLEAATHGQVNAEQLLGLAQQGGGIALRGLSQEGYEHMAIVAQMMGGQRAGTSLLSLRSQLTGTMMKRSAQAMQDYGLLKDGEWSSQGGHVEMTSAATHRMMNLVKSDPMTFVNEMVDRLEAKGITNKDDQMIALQRILGRQTTQRMVADMLLARQQIARETAGLEQGATVDQGLTGFRDNWNVAKANVHAALHNLQVAIGDSGTILTTLAHFTNGFAGFINKTTDWVKSLKPETANLIVQVITGIGVGLITLGAVLTGALVTTIVGLPVIIGGIVAALGVAATAIAAMNWNTIRTSIGAGWDSFWGQVKSDWSHYGDMLSGAFIGITSSISKWIDNIIALYDRVKGLFSGGSAPQSPGDKKFMENKAEADKSYVPMSFRKFDPSNAQPKMQQTSFSLNVDGRSLAQSVVDHFEEIYGLPTGASAADGVHSPFGDQYTSV